MLRGESMDLSKSYEFFQPEMCKDRIHIIGCGSVGSTVAELLARFGLQEMSLYDFDEVEPKNIVNQMFTYNDIGKPKVDAVADIICSINPEAKDKLKLYPKGWIGQKLNGYVFLCVDNIETRKEIVKQNMLNQFIKAMFDFRTRLTDAQHYAANWGSKKAREAFYASMDFTHEEAMEATPMSACHVTLSVAPTVRMICNAGVTNFINFVKEDKLIPLILTDAFTFQLDAIR